MTFAQLFNNLIFCLCWYDLFELHPETLTLKMLYIQWFLRNFGWSTSCILHFILCWRYKTPMYLHKTYYEIADSVSHKLWHVKIHRCLNYTRNITRNGVLKIPITLSSPSLLHSSLDTFRNYTFTFHEWCFVFFSRRNWPRCVQPMLKFCATFWKGIHCVICHQTFKVCY